MMWTNAQIAAFQRVIADCNKYLPIIEQFETIAQAAPQFADSVRELRARCDHALIIAQTALTAHNNVSR